MGEDKKLSDQTINDIIVAHNTFLEKLDELLISSDIFSSEEKYIILTDFQNKINSKIDAEIYIQEKRLNMGLTTNATNISSFPADSSTSTNITRIKPWQF